MNKLLVLLALIGSPTLVLAGTAEEIQTIKTADTFLGSISNTTDFDTKVLLSHLEKLGKIEESSTLTLDEKVQVFLLESGLCGKYAEQNKSARYGKLAFDKIKLALKASPADKNAVLAHATTVSRFTEKSRVSRFFIERSLDISIVAEVRLGISNLDGLLAREPVNANAQSLMKKLKSFMGESRAR